jgi:tetratricopeptide (TPR) repeat protein
MAQAQCLSHVPSTCLFNQSPIMLLKKMKMKHLFFLLVAVCCVATSANAQKFKAAKKQATKALSLASDASKIDEAKTMLDEAIAQGEASVDKKEGDMAKLYLMKGQLFGKLVSADADAIQISSVKGDKANLTAGTAAASAIDAYEKALAAGAKGGDQKAVFTGMKDLASNLNITAREKYQREDFKGSQSDFASVVAVGDLLGKNGGGKLFDDAATFDEIMYFAGIAAIQGEQPEKAVPLYERLYEAGTDKPLVYEILFNEKVKTNEAEALKILDKGLQKFPEEKSLQYAQINHYIQKGKFGELESKLQNAIKADPENISLYLTLANVYDNIHQDAAKNNDAAKTKQYFEKAKATYDQTLEKDPKNFNALYSVGAMYYNKAANLTKEAADITYSKATAPKIDALTKQANDYFQQAKPYFEKAYGVNAKDESVLTALREIAVRTNDSAGLAKYKAELDALKN